MDNIVIMVPTEREAAFFAENGLRADICGAGMAECAATAAHLFAGQRPGLAILAGIAGSYTDDPSKGDTVVVASETIADLGRAGADGGFTPLFQKTYEATMILPGFPAVRSNTVNTAGGMSGDIPPSRSPRVPYGTVIENMEGAAFFAVCERLGVPAMEVRTISNRVGEPVTPADLDLAARRLADDLAGIIRRL